MSLVSCARVGDALTEWLDTASQLKKTALCEALACGPTNEQIAAVFMNCDGVVHIPGESIPSCDEMDAAISAAIEAIFIGGSDGQVWTKAADGTQGWADVRAIPECEAVPSLWELLTTLGPGLTGPVDMEYGHFSAVVKLGENVVGAGTTLVFHSSWDDTDGLATLGGEIVLPALPSAPTGLSAALVVMEVYPFASGQQVGMLCSMTGVDTNDEWGETCVMHVTNLTSGEASTVSFDYDPNTPAVPQFSLFPPGFFNTTDTYCLNISLMKAATAI